MNRLEALSPELAARLHQASAANQRAVCLAACEFAVAHTKIEHPLVGRALKRVRAAGVFTAEESADLDALVSRLDEEYFDLQKVAEEGLASTDDYMRAFAQARAVAALSFAGGKNAFEAATETVYEAAATTDDKEKLFALIESILK